MWAKLPQKHIKLFEKKKKHLRKEREKENGQWGWELVRKDGGKRLDSGPDRLAKWRLVFDADLSNHTERTNQMSGVQGVQGRTPCLIIRFMLDNSGVSLAGFGSIKAIFLHF